MLSFIPAESYKERKYQPLVEQSPPHTPVRELSKKSKALEREVTYDVTGHLKVIFSPFGPDEHRYENIDLKRKQSRHVDFVCA